ncbi:MAG: hypothetical protein ACFHHU_14010 [Porticoccaceae bacterium]
MKLQFRILLCCSLTVFADLASAQCDGNILTIFDTDFAQCGIGAANERAERSGLVALY